MRVDADLVVGRRVPPQSAESRHAWVLFRDSENEFLFEPACQDRSLSIRPVEEVRHAYIPEFGVSAARRRFYFAGYAYFLQNRHLGRTRHGPADRGTATAVSVGPAAR
jgi:hypothetical protein